MHRAKHRAKERCTYIFQIHARPGVYRESGFAPVLLPGVVDVRSAGEQRHRSKFPTTNHGYLNAEQHVSRNSNAIYDNVNLTRPAPHRKVHSSEAAALKAYGRSNYDLYTDKRSDKVSVPTFFFYGGTSLKKKWYKKDDKKSDQVYECYYMHV